jgi:type III secretion protein J
VRAHTGGKVGASSLRAAFGAALLSSLGGCATPAASSLPESEANRAVVALEAQGVSAEKERDPDSEGHFRVMVGRDEAAAAASVLEREAVPGPTTPGILQSLGAGSMVPSRLAEHARLLSGISGELEHSLAEVDGVVSARVHLAAPEQGPLVSEQAKEKPSASVLLRHRGATPPLASSEVQRLVAGAVPGLEPTAVSVVLSSAPAGARPAERELRRVGPITVTRASLPPLRAALACAVLLNLALLAAVLLLWHKARRALDALGQARMSEDDAAAR